MARRKSLEAWIRETLTITAEECGKQCDALTLAHTTGSGGHLKEIHTIKFNGGRSWDARTLAERFQGIAETHAQDAPGPQYFQLGCLFEGDNTPTAFLPFVVNNQPPDLNGTTEAPDGRGQVAQAMRHNESVLSLVFARQQRMDDMMMQTINQLSNRLNAESAASDNLRGQLADAFEVMSEIVVERADRNHVHRMAELQFERQSAERERLIQLAPALLTMLTGKELLPQASADTALIDAIAAHITPEQAMMLAQSFPPQVVALIMDRFSRAADKRKALEKGETQQDNISKMVETAIAKPATENDNG